MPAFVTSRLHLTRLSIFFQVNPDHVCCSLHAKTVTQTTLHQDLGSSRHHRLCVLLFELRISIRGNEPFQAQMNLGLGRLNVGISW